MSNNSLIEFIKSKSFLKHLSFAAISVILILFGLLQFLSSFTDHGESLDVPSFAGVKIKDLDAFISKYNLRYQIIDSVYSDEYPKGTVVDQTPASKFKVKDNRMVYLTVNAMLPQQIKMPNLKDASLRQATSLLESYGLKLGSIQYVPDIAQNAVIDQLYKGRRIKAGESIVKGATISLILGKGLSDEEVEVPYLIGLTRKAALEVFRNRLNIYKFKVLSLNNLIIGAEVYEGSPQDSMKVWVMKQKPGYSSTSKVKGGSAVDLFYTTDVTKATTDTLAISED